MPRRVLKEELARRRWTEGELGSRRKGDREKMEMGSKLRARTTMTLKWIAQRLKIGIDTRFKLRGVIMNLFFSYEEIPELAHLTPVEKRLRWRTTKEQLRLRDPWSTRVPLICCAIGATAGWLLSPFVVAAFYHAESRKISGTLLVLSFICSGVGSCVGGVSGGFIGQQLLIAKIRKYLQHASRRQ